MLPSQAGLVHKWLAHMRPAGHSASCEQVMLSVSILEATQHDQAASNFGTARHCVIQQLHALSLIRTEQPCSERPWS